MREYNIESIQGLKSYAESNRALAGKLVEQAGTEPLEIPITFHNYMSIEEFNSWASALGIHPSNVEVRVAYDTDPLYTPAPHRGAPSLGSPGALLIDLHDSNGGVEQLSQARLDAELARQEENALARGYIFHEVKGVYFTTASVQPEQLQAIEASAPVFLADISYEWPVYDLRTTEGWNKESITYGQSMRNRVFGLMEHFGLDNFAK